MRRSVRHPSHVQLSLMGQESDRAPQDRFFRGHGLAARIQSDSGAVRNDGNQLLQ